MSIIGLLAFSISSQAADDPPHISLAVGLSMSVEYIEQKEYSLAIDLLKEVAKDFPSSPLPDYNIACAYALSGDSESSIKYLSASVKKGFCQVSLLNRDPDLEAARGSTEFRDISVMASKIFLSDVQYYVQEPIGYDRTKKYGLIIHMGGVGSDGSDWAAYWRAIQTRSPISEFVIISVQYLPGETTDVYREGELPENAFESLCVLAQSRWSIDPSRTVISGFSSGAGAAELFVLRRADRLFNLMIIEGGADLRKLNTKERSALQKSQIRVAILNGERPGLFRVFTEVIASQLRSAGLEFRYRLFRQDELHAIGVDASGQIAESLLWLMRPRPSEAPPSKITSVEELRFTSHVAGDSLRGASRPLLIFLVNAIGSVSEWKERFVGNRPTSGILNSA